MLEQLISLAEQYPQLLFFILAIGAISGQLVDLMYRIGRKIQLAEIRREPEEPLPLRRF